MEILGPSESSVIWQSPSEFDWNKRRQGSGLSPWMVSIQAEKYESFHYIIRKEALNLDLVNNNKATALPLTVDLEAKQMTRALIARGAKHKKLNRNNFSSVDMAISTQNNAIMQLFILVVVSDKSIKHLKTMRNLPLDWNIRDSRGHTHIMVSIW